MASTLESTVALQPLKEFQKIGYNSYLYTCPTFGPKSALVLLFAWNAAAAKHIAKYTASYQKLLPDCRILLIRGDTHDFFWTSKQYTKIHAPGVQLVKDHVDQGGSVLIHSFSNGGANQLVEFAKAYKTAHGTVLPCRAQILDSSPGNGGNYWRSYLAIKHGLPKTLFFRLFGWLIVHAFLGLTGLFWILSRQPNNIIQIGRHLNGPELFDRRVPRVYLYSKKDEVIGPEEVEEHADDAQKKGWQVRKVVFESSPHAGHVREDEGKYWGAVMQAWSGSS
jgi:hypothetical protein